MIAKRTRQIGILPRCQTRDYVEHPPTNAQSSRTVPYDISVAREAVYGKSEKATSMKSRKISLICLAALALSWGGFNLGRSLLGPKFGLDFTQYYISSRMVLDGEAHNIYRTDGYYQSKALSYGAVTDVGGTMTNAYPPFVAFCLIPFALFPFRVSLLVFTITSFLALAAGVWAFFANADDSSRRDLTLAGLLIAFSFFPVYYSFYMGQVNVMLFLFIALVLYYSRRGQPWRAGFFTALATLFKIFPVVLVVYFAVKRQFKAATAAMVFTVVLGTASLSVCGPSLYRDYLFAVLPHQTQGGAFFRNQGFPGLFARLFTENDYVNALSNRPALARELGVAGGVLALALALWAAARRDRHGTCDDLELGLCLVATLLALSKSWEHYGVLLLFAYLAIVKLVFRAKSIPRTPVLLTFLSFFIWTFLLPQGTDYAELPRNILVQPLFSAKCLATVMLFIASIWFMLISDRGEVL
jgi:hypothetical protein